jgi:UPF0042 nucleotide-binding protein
LRQPQAARFLDEVQRMVAGLVPLYEQKGMKHVVVAFGCSGGRHRSVALAAELARRLRDVEGIDVDFVTRDID